MGEVEEGGTKVKERSTRLYLIEAAVPAIIVGAIFLIGSIGTVAIYGTPWECKEKADSRETLFNHELAQTTAQLQTTAELLANLRLDFAAEKQHEEDRDAEEERRLKALEDEHPRR